MKDFDVIIIGAGPAGSVTADTIAKKGWRVVLLEKDKTPGKNNVCGGMVSLDIVEKFDIKTDIIEKTLHKQVYFFPFGKVAVESLPCPQVTVLRRDFDNYLADKAVKAGAKLFTNTKATNIHFVSPGHVEIETAKRNSHSSEMIAGKIVIFADGVSTIARRFGGLGFRKRAKNTAFALAYELEWPQNTMDHFEIYFIPEIARWGYAWIFPKKNILNVGMGCILAELNHKKNLPYRLKNFVETSPLLRDKKIIRKRGAFIPMGSARKIYGDSTLLVGDAAGMVHPLLGSGIGNAMEAGELAGHISDEALEREDFSEEYLSRYQIAWENHESYTFLKKQELIAKFCIPLSRIDKNISAKVNQLLLLRDRINALDAIKVLAYPLLGTPKLGRRTAQEI
jgi:digeranylgeranylglycerophospholipid reductase